MTDAATPAETELCIHATTVALGKVAAVLLGPSGAGKSDLALRFLAQQGWPADGLVRALVADDQTILRRGTDGLIASAAPQIAGRLEVRGIGIVPVLSVPHGTVRLAIELVAPQDVERFPLHERTKTWLGGTVPLRRLTPFEASAAVKLAVMLAQSVDS